MMSKEYIFNYLKNLIKENPGKLILLFLFIVFYNFSGTFEDTIKEYQIIDNYEIKGEKFITLENTNPSNEITLINEKKIDLDNYKIEGDVLINSEYNDLNFLFWLLTGLFAFIFLILTFSDDEGWSFSYIRKKTIKEMIRSEEEGGFYYYYVFGKLIQKSTNVINYHDFRYFDVDNLQVLPDYTPKKELREKRLKELGL